MSESTGVPGERLRDPGVVHNTLMQLATQIAGAVFSAGLIFYLVRALGPSSFGVYSLAISIAALAVLPAGLGLPLSVARFLADHLNDIAQLRAIFGLGLRLQIAAGALGSAILFALAGPLADAFGEPKLGWPLRWVAVSVTGQTLFAFLSAAVASVRRSATGLWMATLESAVETTSSVLLVVAGAGAAGAALGKALGYSIATVAGTWLMLRLLGGGLRQAATRAAIGAGAITRYAGATFIVDIGWVAISQVDVVLIGALLTSVAVGSFSAVLRLLVVLSYLPLAVSSGVAPRLSLRGGRPDTRAFAGGIRLLILVQGFALAPMVVWAAPIVGVALGHGYRSSPAILRVLTLQPIVGASSSLVALSLTYMGEARRRIPIVIVSLFLGLLATYLLIRVLGVLGAAIGDDLVAVAYLAGNLWVFTRLIEFDLRPLVWSFARTLVAAGAMAGALLAAGTDHLSVFRAILGLVAGTIAYPLVLFATRETSSAELQALADWLRRRLSRNG